jgi:hypothetical protein
MLPLLRACRLPHLAPLRPALRPLCAAAAPPPPPPEPAPPTGGINARIRLKEECDARGLAFDFSDDGGTGPSHAPVFVATLRVTDARGSDSASASGRGTPVLTGTGRGASRKAAQEAAAASALASWAAALPVRGAEREALAVVGDAALDTLVVLLAHERGLAAPEIDALRQRLLCNQALGEGAGGRALATSAEADVGAALLAGGAGVELTRLLLAAVRRADPKLAQRLQDEVARAPRSAA